MSKKPKVVIKQNETLQSIDEELDGALHLLDDANQKVADLLQEFEPPSQAEAGEGAEIAETVNTIRRSDSEASSDSEDDPEVDTDSDDDSESDDDEDYEDIDDDDYDEDEDEEYGDEDFEDEDEDDEEA